MQHTTAVLFCLLLVTLGPQNSFGRSLVDSKSTCCFNFLKKLPSPHHIRSHMITSPSCSYKAVMFTLKKGKIVCAHFDDKSVQHYLQKMNKTNNIGPI
ncbi:C-C motif chemokine 13-like [Macrotis lagotis]|uniref:C-C motif chemokine 13-like n=1 Tax=Macrotis lagotis TaxID=92651 RepID=UPI003D68F6DC